MAKSSRSRASERRAERSSALAEREKPSKEGKSPSKPRKRFKGPVALLFKGATWFLVWAFMVLVTVVMLIVCTESILPFSGELILYGSGLDGSSSLAALLTVYFIPALFLMLFVFLGCVLLLRALWRSLSSWARRLISELCVVAPASDDTDREGK